MSNKPQHAISHNGKQQNIVVVDIDDTLHFNQICICRVAEEHGYVFDVEDLVEWTTLIEKCGGLGSFTVILNETYQRQHDDPEWAPLFPGAVEAMQYLDDHEFEIHYFTDRPPDHKYTTPRWLEAHGFPQVENTHVCRDKRDDIRKLDTERIVAIFDDRPRTMDWAHHTIGIPHVLALKFPHNRCMSDMEWVHLAEDWEELRKEMDRRIVLPVVR